MVKGAVNLVMENLDVNTKCESKVSVIHYLLIDIAINAAM